VTADDPRTPQQVPPWWTDPTENVKDNLESERRRQDDLREMQARYAEQISALRAEHARELRLAEAARIDAIREVDVAAARQVAEAATTTATTLAAQVAAAAEAARSAVAAAAAAAVTSLAAALEPIQKDIRDLRDSQARGVGGKEQVTETREVRADTRQGANLNLTALSVLLGAIVIAITLYAALHGH
jgi:hypothetical protein